jgi:reactive intermediate/imine deaminase
MVSAMSLKTINPESLAPPGGHYSHVAVANGMVFVAGQLPIDPAGTRLVDASFEVQAAQALANVEAALLAAGSHKESLVQVRVYVTDIDKWPAFNTLYASWLGPHRPARAVVPVPVLHYGFLIEIEATALSVQ